MRTLHQKFEYSEINCGDAINFKICIYQNLKIATKHHPIDQMLYRVVHCANFFTVILLWNMPYMQGSRKCVPGVPMASDKSLLSDKLKFKAMGKFIYFYQSDKQTNIFYKLALSSMVPGSANMMSHLSNNSYLVSQIDIQGKQICPISWTICQIYPRSCPQCLLFQVK